MLNRIKKDCNRFMELYSLFREYNKGVICSLFESMKLVVKSYIYHSDERAYSASIYDIGHGKYEISYTIPENDTESLYYKQSRKYKIIICPLRGPKPDRIQILNQEGKDVTEYVFPYLGPDLKFHQAYKHTPLKLGFESLVFNIGDESNYFVSDETINLS
jgi:hypothetical protein